MSVHRALSHAEVCQFFEPLVINALKNPDEVTGPHVMKVHTVVHNVTCANSDGEEIYMYLSDLVKKVVAEERDSAMLSLPDSELLTFVCARWRKIGRSVTILDTAFTALNQTWIRNQKSSNADVLQVGALITKLCSAELFVPLRARVIDATLALIEHDRAGEPVDIAIVAEATQCLEQLGAYLDFEKAFLQATRDRFAATNSVVMIEDNVCSYVQFAEDLVGAEIRRARACLRDRTQTPLIAIMCDVFIKRHLATLQASLPSLFASMQHADLARMYAFLTHLGSAGLEPLCAELKKHVAHELVQEIAGRGDDSAEALFALLQLLHQKYSTLARESFHDNVSLHASYTEALCDALEQHIVVAGRRAFVADVDRAKDEPDVFVAILLCVFRKYQKLIKDAFVDDAGFIGAQDNAFRAFIDNNAATQVDDASSQAAVAPQMLVKYCDMILRKGNKHISDGAEMERTLDELVALFKCLADKDVFMMAYKKLLSKRLIGGQSGNDDFEAAMINKLKASHGLEFTSSLQRMVQDLATSKDINAAFMDWCVANNEKVPFDLSISVLATGIWPLQAASTPFVAPHALVEPMALFKTFYSSKHSGRKLTYLHHLGKVELAVSYATKGRLHVTVSTFQLAVLVQFDAAQRDSVTFGDLCAATLLQEQPLKMALLAMLKLKFISCAAKHTTWNESTEFSLVKDFKSARNRINLNVQVSADDGFKLAPPVEAPEVRREREQKLQAAIVLKMKSRKTMTHQQLLSEVTQQVQKWFTPTVAEIKKVIEDLIAKEYMKRDTDADDASPESKNYVYI